MDFDFTPEQEQLRDAVARWAAGSYGFQRRCEVMAQGGTDRGVHAELAALGLTALWVSEAHGGLGLGPVEAMVVMEELGRGLVTEPLPQAWICSTILATHASAELQAHWLPRIADGSARVVLAHQERHARYRLDTVKTIAIHSGDGYHLSGMKNLVPAGDQADAWLVPAVLDGRLALFLVEHGAQGTAARGYLTQDESRAADVEFIVTPATLVTQDAVAALTQAQDIGIACACAEGTGAMERLLALTVEHMRQRQQFGVPIASFQALRHRVADMKMQLELARSMSYYATLKLNAPASERRLALSRAKVQLGHSMRFVGQQAVQLHGGIGVTDEYAGSHYFKRLTQLEMTWGDTLHHLAYVSEHMQGTAGVLA